MADVDIDQAEKIAVDFVKKKKNIDKVNVSKVTMGGVASKPDDWEIRGSTTDETFTILVSGGSGTIISYEFYDKRPSFVS